MKPEVILHSFGYLTQAAATTVAVSLAGIVLGFVIGARVSVVNENSGNMILDVKGSRIAMDRAVASKIFFVPS